ncbi:leucine-rich repeat domain-containing protein [Galbibacter mesophilus]|uniref:leucine-rich repeat domain-containing protein n=1 Tax=Galbibacter mesophilus TaxID=379069 RepID=UPI00191EB8B9|nr:immunoglobulin domain-containing protein [Galbibacter mesophilus]MCM5662594.1 immunoglobulin domain-containing protein [Galbibacter mesophilus]
MRKIYLAIAMAIIPLISICQENLLSNGDLENWSSGQLDSWTITQTNQIIQETTNLTSGTSSALFIDGEEQPSIYMSGIQLEAGKTYILSYDYKVKTGSSSFGSQVIGVKHGAEDFTPNSSGSRNPLNFEWNSVSKEIEVLETEPWYFEFSIFSFLDEAFEVYIDNIKLIEKPQPSPDRETLIALYNATDGPNWKNTWDLEKTASEWGGIQLNNENRVENIGFYNNNLTGSLPESFGDLTSLKYISIIEDLEGEIPESIGNLTKLKSLGLNFNDFTGNIPESIGNLIDLNTIRINYNKLTGSIPESFGNLINLTELSLIYNSLTGPIPKAITQLPKLETLDIVGNKFVFEDIEKVLTTINETIAFNYKNQQKIDEEAVLKIDRGNPFLIQVEATSSPNNKYQWFKNEIAIQGATNSSYKIDSVAVVDKGVYTCKITNSVITDLTLYKNTITLDVSIPDSDNDGVNNDLDKCPETKNGENVDYYGCAQNQLDNDNDGVTNDIDECPETTDGQPVNSNGCAQNQLLKNPSFEKWTLVASEHADGWYVNFDTNKSKVTGASDGKYAIKIQTNRSGSNGFFAKLDAAAPLNDLSLEAEKIYRVSFDYKVSSGTIKELKSTILEDNFYVFDSNITNDLTNSYWQTISYYVTPEKSGTYNYSINIIGDTEASEIIIDNVKFEEYIYSPDREALIELYNATDGPNWSTNWDINQPISEWERIRINEENRVTYIYFYLNNLAGHIPNSIGNLTSLTYLVLIDNKLKGSIPESIGNLTNLTDLSLHGSLESEIPKSIGNLINLSHLSLSRNNLTGTLPESIGNLINLTELYLDGNYLTGTIPEAIIKLPNLTTLDIAYNKFVFEDIEEILKSINENITFNYKNQKKIDEESTITIDRDSQFLVKVEATSSPNNIYQWFKDDVAIEGATNSSFKIDSVAISDEGEYTCKITNTVATELTLYKNPITLEVSIPDSDNDGINDDIDECPNTPNGEDVDYKGCTPYQVDDDKDGVPNYIDECPETTLGEVVDEKGCAAGDVINSRAIKIKAVDTSCPNTNNGEISVESFNNMDYTFTVSGPNYNEAFTDVDKNEANLITDLAPGSYEVCVSYVGYEDSNYCFTANIKATEEMTASKAFISLQNKKASFKVSGNAHYTVSVNNKLFEFHVENAEPTTIQVPITDGKNEIILKTDKDCQGQYNETIDFREVSFYPNPVVDNLNIGGLSNLKNVEIHISDMAGNIVFHRKMKDFSSNTKLSLEGLSSGVYLINITSDSQNITSKILKK